MDPGTIVISVLGLVLQFLSLFRGFKGIDGGINALKHSKRRRQKLELDGFNADELYLKLARDIEEKAHAVGFPSNSLDKLHNELKQFVSSVKDVLCSNNSQKADIQQLREMCVKDSVDIKIVGEMMQEILSKNNGVHINIFQGQAHGNLMPKWELLYRVMNADAHLNLGMSKKEVGPPVDPLNVADSSIIKGVEKEASSKKQQRPAPCGLFLTSHRC